MPRDLRGTGIASAFENFFDSICVGNDGEAEIQKLELSDSGILSYDVQVRHRQVTTVHISFNGNKNIIAYSLTTHATGEIDPRSADPSEVQFGVDTPFGTVPVNLTELLEAIATMF
jgi:hypothetical protein